MTFLLDFLTVYCQWFHLLSHSRIYFNRLTQTLRKDISVHLNDLDIYFKYIHIGRSPWSWRKGWSQVHTTDGGYEGSIWTWKGSGCTKREGCCTAEVNLYKATLYLSDLQGSYNFRDIVITNFLNFKFEISGTRDTYNKIFLIFQVWKTVGTRRGVLPAAKKKVVRRNPRGEAEAVGACAQDQTRSRGTTQCVWELAEADSSQGARGT